MTDSVKNQLDTAFRIRRAICQISESQPSFARCVIDQFLPSISPAQVRSQGISFPQTCRRHRGNPERSSVASGVYPMLYFHIGNAILAYYEATIHGECAEMEGRVELLENIARHGLSNYRVEGDDMTGYALIVGPGVAKPVPAMPSIMEPVDPKPLRIGSARKAEEKGNGVSNPVGAQK